MTQPAPLLRATVRVAASPAIGAGHVARCASLAAALRAIGARVRWACDAATMPYLAERGVPAEEAILVPEGTAAAHAGERQAAVSAQRADAAWTVGAGAADWFIVDSYALGSPWHAAVRATGARVAAFDDLADRPLDVDLVINAAAADGTYRSLAPGAREACGLRAAIIGDPGRPPAAGPGQLLLAFGAADPDDLTGATLEGLAAHGAADMRVVVQLGANGPGRARAAGLLARLPDATFAPTAPTSPGTPALCIGAAGVGLLERLHAGVPSVVLVAAENQRALADAAVGTGAAAVAATPREAIDLAARLLADPAALARMSAAGRASVDGHGAARIAREMNRLAGVGLRRARPDDARLLLGWRNHPAVRAVSHSSAEIPWDEHVRWLERSLASTDRHVLVAERHGMPVGTVRFDVAGGCATVSIAVDPALHGTGLGPAILDAGHAWLPHHDPRVSRVRAEILPGNEASVRAFRAAGYSGGPETYERPIGQGSQA